MGKSRFAARLLQSTILVGAAAVFTPSYAQDVDTVPEASAEEDQDLIVVTGSRIRRSEVEASNPVFTLDSSAISDRSFTNVADALNQSPLFGGSLTPAGGQNGFTAGQNQVNLFDLGTQRTLTLINGRRMVSSNSAAFFGSTPGSQVDLNTIPVSMVERIETVPLIGAATYGSDAIAGTVNVILKDDFEGLEIRSQYGSNFSTNADSYQLATLAGANFADGRGNVTFSAEYTKDEGLLLCEDSFWCDGDPNLVNITGQNLDVDGDGTIDNFGDSINAVFFDQNVQLFGPGGTVSTGLLIPTSGLGAFADGNFYQFDPNGDLIACEPGERPRGSSAFFSQGGTCGIDFFDTVTQIRSPVERFNAFSAINYEITDNVRFRQDFLFANTQGEELVNQGGFQTWAFGGTSAAITLDVNNPFLTSQARGVLTDNGISSFLLNRFNNDIVSSGANSNETQVYRISNILEGDFEKWGRNFYWDVSAIYGQSDVTTNTIGIIDGRFINAVDARRVDDALLTTIMEQGTPGDTSDDLASLDAALTALNNLGSSVATAARGDIICGAYADLAAGTLEGFSETASGFGVTDEQNPFLDGCQPLNLFGEGAASPEAIAFINGAPIQTQSSNEQTIWAANFGGDLVDIPAGTVAFNVGLETRREETAFVPGMGAAVPFTRSAVSAPVSGRATTQEVYGEVLVPVVSSDMNIPFVQSFELNGAARYQEFKTTAPSGATATTESDVYSISASWVPVEDIKIRASYATSFRNPSFTELFSPEVSAFVNGDDPCDSREVDFGVNPDVRRANCVADGIDPDTFTSNIQNATISNGLNSGNAALIPEESKTWTVGFVAEPRWVPGMAIAVDYYNLEITDAIEFLEFEDLIAVCYDSNDFPNEAACDTFERDATGQVTFASETYQNAALSEFEAVTARVFYEFDVNDVFSLAGKDVGTDLGSLSFDSFMQHNIRNDEQATLSSEVQDDVGDFADPQWLGTFDTVWELDKWRVSHRTRWQSKVLIDSLDQQVYTVVNEPIVDNGVAGITVDPVRQTDARFIQDLSVRYDINDTFQVQANVLNLTDHKPDTLQFAAGHFGVDEQLGRRYTFRLIGRF